MLLSAAVVVVVVAAVDLIPINLHRYEEPPLDRNCLCSL